MNQRWQWLDISQLVIIDLDLEKGHKVKGQGHILNFDTVVCAILLLNHKRYRNKSFTKMCIILRSWKVTINDLTFERVISPGSIKYSVYSVISVTMTDIYMKPYIISHHWPWPWKWTQGQRSRSRLKFWHYLVIAISLKR